MKQFTKLRGLLFGGFLSTFLCFTYTVGAQTVLLDPAGDGGFETGVTFADNGWTVSNSANNPWVIGTAYSANAPFSNRTAYLSNDGGLSASYTPANNATNYFYRDITVPAGEDIILLSLNWYQMGEGSTWDIWQVFTAPTSITPVGVESHPGNGAAIVPPGIAGATYVGGGFLLTLPINPVSTTYQLPASLAGTTFRLIFSWKNEAGGTQPPAILDNIGLTSQAAVPICGIKTIDSSLPTGGDNYNSFTAAINALNFNGICGAVTFNVAAGQTFNELPPVINVTGTALNTITFQKDGAGANPVISAAGTATANEAALHVAGGDYFTFDGIDVTGTTSALESGYRIRNSSATNGATDNIVRNCTVSLTPSLTGVVGVYVTSSTLGGGFTPTSADGATSNNLIENVTVINAYSGIYVISGSSSWPGVNNQVVQCTVGAPYIGIPTGSIGNPSFGTATWGIQFNTQSNGVIRNNTVQNIVTTGINRGIYTFTCMGTTLIHSNVVRGVRNPGTGSFSTQRGIELNQFTTGANTTRVYNNMVSDITSAFTGAATATRIVTGIFVTNGGASMVYEIDFNSVHINSGSVTCSSTCLDLSVVTSLHRIRSNTFTNFTGAQAGVAKHYAIRTGGTNTIGIAGSVSDYNNLFVQNANGFVGHTSVTDQPTIAAWTAAITVQPNTDLNSVGVDPFFLDPALDLHATGAGLVGAAIPGGVAHVTVDIDGATRLDPSSIGADEYIPATCFPPTGLAATNVTATSVDISWTDNGSTLYNWEIRSSGAAGSGPAGLEDSGNTTGNTASSSVLPDQTTMAVYVQAVCAGPVLSNWSPAVGFTTPCLPATLPWSDSFEAATVDNGLPLPCYGKQIITGTDASTWRTRITPIQNGIGPRTGTDYMAHNWSANSWLFSPGFDMVAGSTYQFSYWYVHTQVTTTGFDMNTAVGTAQTAAAMTTVLSSITNINNTGYLENVVTFTPSSNGIYYFGLQAIAGGSPWYLCTDDWSVIELVPCSSEPAAAVIPSTVSGCFGTPNTITATSFDLGSGISFQWQQWDTGLNDWVNAVGGSGANTTTYNTPNLSVQTDYRLATTCNLVDSTSYSNVSTVSLVPCYCTTNLYTTGTGVGDLISYVGITGTTLDNNSGFVQGTPNYVYYPPNPPSNTYTAELQAGGAYTVNVSTGEWGSQGFAVWIDYNDDGQYTLDERVGATVGVVGSGVTPGQVNASASFPIALSCAPALGLHRMRVRCVFALNGVEIDPCALYSFGEVEEYDVLITAPDPCPMPNSLVFSNYTGTQVQTNWNVGCEEELWDIHVTSIGGGEPVGAPSNPGVLNGGIITGLTANTNYDFYLRADCDDDGVSDWAGPFSFYAPPINDDCSGAVPVALLDGVPHVFTGNTNSATNTTDGPFNAYPTVWEAVILSASCNNLTLAYCGNTPAFGNVWINLALDCPVTSFTPASTDFNNTACGDGNYTINYYNLAPGTYYIPIMGFAAGFNVEGPYTLTVTTNECPPPPTASCEPGLSASPNAFIPSNGIPTVSSINVGPQAGGTFIQDLNVAVQITHSWIGDISISLTSPCGTTVSLQAQQCGSFQNMEALFDDEADDNFSTWCPNRFGAVIPQSALSAFNDEPINGLWTLSVVDPFGGFDGTLVQWCLVPTLTTCVDPLLATSNITDTTIDVDILTVACVPGGTYSTFDVSWESSPGCITSDCGSATGVTFPYTITGLNPSTFYDITVVANCTAGGSSGLVGTGVSTIACPVSETCNYTLILNRTAGLGFGSALVEVDNGWSVTSYNLPSNLNTISYPIIACPGVQLSVSMNNGGNGSLDNSHRVRLTNSGNVNVLDVFGPGEGQLIVLPDPCPDCTSPVNLALGQTAADYVEVSWSNGGDPADDYLVELFDVSFIFPTIIDFVIVSGTSTSFTFPSSPGLELEVCVTSNCTNGGASSQTCISFIAPSCDAADQCEYLISAADAGGNGWGEYGIEILVDGGAQTIPYTLLSGSSGSLSFFTCGGSSIEVLSAASGPGGGGPGPFTGCNVNTSLFPGATIAISPTGTPTLIAGNSWTTEYSNVSISVGGLYEFSTTVATDYITFANSSGTILANGSVTPLVVSIPTPGTYRVYWNNDAACGQSTVSRGTSGRRLITCAEPSVSLILNPSTDNYAQFSASAGSFCDWTDGQTLYAGTTCPTCFDLSANTVSNVTGTTAQFSWFSANGPGTDATIYVGAPGFDYTDPLDVLYSSTVAITVVGTNTYVFPGLSPLTSFEAVIVEECNAPSGDFSLPSSVMAFTTLSLCPTPSALSAVPGGSTAQVSFSSFYSGADYTLTIALASAPLTILQTLNGTAAIGPNTVPVSGLSFSSTYQYCVSIVCGLDGSAGPVCGTFTTGAFENDLCGGALPITCGNTYSGTTVGASTTGQLLTTCGTTPGAGGVWYVMNNTQGIVTISTCAAVGYDTKLFVYSGSCAAPVCVTGNDDDFTCSFSGLRSTVQFYAQATETYYVVVSGFSTAQGEFEMNVSCVECLTPLSNQNCGTAQTLISQPDGVACTPTTANLVCGGPISTIPTCSGGAGLDLWYSVVATHTTHVMQLTLGTATSVGVALHQPCGVSLGCLAAVGGVVQLNGLTIGATYNIQVFSTFANAGTFNICIQDPPPPAPNDLCSGALPLTPGIATCGPTQPFNSLNFATTNSPVAAPPCGAYGGLDQWYSVVVPAGGTVTVRTNAGSITNTALAAYIGTCGALTLIGCTGDGGEGLLAQLQITSTPGSTVYIRAWAEGGGLIGTFSVCAIAPPTNDQCATPADVNIVAETCFNQVGSVNFATSTNTPTVPFSSCATNGGGRDVWYEFTAETSTMFITAQGINGSFDMVIEGWDGCAGTLLGCVNNTGGSTPPSVPQGCWAATGTPGYPSDPTCEAAICLADPFCCNTSWDGICANAALISPSCTSCGSYLNPAGPNGIEDLTLTGLTPGNTYLLRFYHNALTPPSGNGLFTFCVRHTWNAELIPSQCNVMNYISNDVLQAVYPGGQYTFSGPLRNPIIHVPQDFEWKFVNTVTLNEYTYIRGSANYNCALHWPEDALGNPMDYNQTYDVFVRIKVNNIWGDYSNSCTIGLIEAPAATQLRPNWTPTNPQGQSYTLCNTLWANAIAWADRYEFELDNGVDPVLLAESNSYQISLSAFAGIQMNTIYQVRVRCRVNGVWGPQGPALPIIIGLPANTSVWVSHCNTTRPATGPGATISAYNVCAVSEYVFRFQHGSEPERLVVRPTYVCPFNVVSPPLTPGQTYTVSVRVTQGGVQGDYSTSCPITIAGPQAEGFAGTAASKVSLEEITAAIFPNPNAGDQVSINIGNIADEYQKVTVDMYDIYGKRVHIEEFANSGSELNRVITFGQELAPGMYLINIYLNDEQVLSEKLVVQ